MKTCLYKILGTSSSDLGVSASTLRGRWSKMVPEPSRGLTKGFDAGRKLAQLSCWCLQSYAHLSSERVAELHVFEFFLSAGEL